MASRLDYPALDEPFGDADADAAEQAAERSLVDDVRQLADDARRLAEAEVVYQKARTAFALAELRTIFALGLAAVAMVFIALMALTFGLILALSPHLTAWGATGVVVSALILATLACGTWASVLWRGMVARLGGSGKRA
ncbi:MAG TPA: hypothetical protein VF440_03695 [Novosphingobium sp.]